MTAEGAPSAMPSQDHIETLFVTAALTIIKRDAHSLSILRNLATHRLCYNLTIGRDGFYLHNSQELELLVASLKKIYVYADGIR